MNFGEKIKSLREGCGWTQQELAAKLNLSLRTICAYENDNVLPRTRKRYTEIAELFEVNVNYLLTDENDFILNAGVTFGKEGQREAKELIQGVLGLFAGGAMSLEDKKVVLDAIQEAYYIAKSEAKKARLKEEK